MLSPFPFFTFFRHTPKIDRDPINCNLGLHHHIPLPPHQHTCIPWHPEPQSKCTTQQATQLDINTMSSNPPPPITPNTNTNANFAHDDNTAPTVPVVTQASQLAHQFDLVSKPTQQNNSGFLSWCKGQSVEYPAPLVGHDVWQEVRQYLQHLF